jgi:methylaspartate ammonia-lyase
LGEGETPVTRAVENAELVREIVKEAHRDAEQIHLIINLMKCQNIEGIDVRLKAEGALDASKVISDALTIYLVTIITLQYSPLHADDLTLHRAFDILRRKQDIRDEFKIDGSDDALVEPEKYFQNCLDDQRLTTIINFRNKRAVHHAESKKLAPKVKSELYSFAHDTVEAIEKLAIALQVTDKRARDCIDAATAEAFWRRWKD